MQSHIAEPVPQLHNYKISKKENKQFTQIDKHEYCTIVSLPTVLMSLY